MTKLPKLSKASFRHASVLIGNIFQSNLHRRDRFCSNIQIKSQICCTTGDFSASYSRSCEGMALSSALCLCCVSIYNPLPKMGVQSYVEELCLCKCVYLLLKCAKTWKNVFRVADLEATLEICLLARVTSSQILPLQWCCLIVSS